VLSYEASDGVPTVLKRRARFPLGGEVRSGVFQTVVRDLSADLKAAFGLSFGQVKQVGLSGRLAVAHLGLSALVPGMGGGPTLAQEVAVPLSGWTQGGPGTVSQDEYDPVLDGPTLSASPADMRRPRLRLTLPQRSAELIVAFRTLSLFVRDDERFALEVRVKTSAGPMRLRYQPDVSEPQLRGRTLRMPVPEMAIEGSPYKFVSLELAAAVERARPGHTLTRVLGIRLQGKFRIGDVTLSEPLM
jgi:hypothetical protein